MEIINTTFRLGVILAIFGFIWSLIRFSAILLSGGRMGILQSYLLKLIQNFFLIQVTFLFCYEHDSALSLSQNSVVVTLLILVIYFVSKLQNRQQQRFMVNIMRNQFNNTPPTANFDLRAEIGLVVLSLGFFIACIYFPSFAENAFSFWMKDAIINIEDTPIFGFIFKVVGFFFLLSIFGKIFQSIFLIFAPRQFQNTRESDEISGKSDFDDYEEIKDEDQ